MRRSLLAAAALATALTAFAQPAAAQQYRGYHDAHVANQQQCERSRNNRTAGGAVIGGVIGALLGREVADRGVRGEGAGLGAVVGAVAGSAIGRSTARCDEVPNGYDRYGQAEQYPDDGYYRGDDDDLYGGPYEESGYYGEGDYGRDCQVRQEVYRDRYGRRRVEDVYMCRGRDGVWRPE